MMDASAPRTTEHHVTSTDIARLLAGEGGVDLGAVFSGSAQVAMRIVGVTPGSTAARLGAENDDTIESINDVPLTSVSAAYRAADEAVRSGRIVIRGARRGAPYVSVLVIDPG